MGACAVGEDAADVKASVGDLVAADWGAKIGHDEQDAPGRWSRVQQAQKCHVQGLPVTKAGDDTESSGLSRTADENHY